jgi:hypothetical protein
MINGCAATSSTTGISMKHVIVMTAAALALAGCSQRSAVEGAVKDNLKDPDSVRFGTFYYNRSSKRACITVNAKNSMGGYTGDKQVRMEKTTDGWQWIEDREETPDDCRAFFADQGIPEPRKALTGEAAIQQVEHDAAEMEAKAREASGEGALDPLSEAAENAHAEAERNTK